MFEIFKSKSELIKKNEELQKELNLVGSQFNHLRASKLFDLEGTICTLRNEIIRLTDKLEHSEMSTQYYKLKLTEAILKLEKEVQQ